MRGRFAPVGVLERQVREQLVRLDQMRVELECLARPLDGMVIEAPGAHEGEPDIGGGIVRIAHQRIVEQVRRLAIIEALVQQPAPAYAVQSVALRLAHRRAKLCVRGFVAPQSPVTLGSKVIIARAREGLEAGVRLRSVSVPIKRLALSGVRSKSSRRGCNHDENVHRSRASCTFASSTSASVS